MKTPSYWLENELPIWISDNLISEKNAQILLDRYKVQKSKAPFIAIAILSSLLVGLGLISIIAYNWNEFGKYARAFTAILLLVFAQYMAFWVKYKKKNSIAASEGATLFWLLAFGCSFAIITQTYNLGGDFFDFLRVWTILFIPIMYLFNSKSIAFFLAIMIVFLINANYMYDFIEHSGAGNFNILDITLCFAWLFFYIFQLKNNLKANSTSFLNFVFMISVFITLTVQILSRNFIKMDEYWFYMLFLCAIFWLLGVLLYKGYEKYRGSIFEVLSKLYILVFTIILCSNRIYQPSNIYIGGTIFYGFLIVFFVLFALFCMYRRDKFYELLMPLSPIAVYILYFYDSVRMPIMNLFVIIGSLYMIVGGMKKTSILLVNQGLILISILIIMHFFDANIGLLNKGVCFILIGLSFFILNNILVKYSKERK